MFSIDGNFEQFLKEMDKEIEKFDETKKAALMGISLAALKNLQVGSPVDTGRFKAAHTLTVDRIDPSVPPNVDPATKSKRAKLTKDGGGVPPISEYEEISNNKLNDAERELDKKIPKGNIKSIKIYIMNNTEYAQFIENGTYSKDPNAPRKLYAKMRLWIEDKIAEAWNKIGRR